MIILKRQVIATKSVDDVGRVLMSCAYHFPKAIFKASSFSMHCAKRHNGGYLSLIKITGNVLPNEETTKVILEVHANLYFFIGCLIAVLGISGLLYCFFRVQIDGSLSLECVFWDYLWEGSLYGKARKYLTILSIN